MVMGGDRAQIEAKTRPDGGEARMYGRCSENIVYGCRYKIPRTTPYPDLIPNRESRREYIPITSGEGGHT